jgi:nitrilase
MQTAVRVACVQVEPVILDRDATIEKLARFTAEAAQNGAQLVVFPETFIPAYPSSRWAKALAGWADPRAKEAFALLRRESLEVPSDAERRLGEAAREHGVWLVTGVNEVDPVKPGTIYNSLLYHSPDGTLAEHHRKLVPTNHERLIWGQGDGRGLRAFETPLGRLGGLICWENYMPLARFHLYAQGVDVWVAPTLATGDAWVATMRHIAREGRLFVIGVNPCIHADQLPASIPRPEALYPPGDREDQGGWLMPGNTVIVDPTGAVMAGPVREEERVVSAELDLDLVRTARRFFDPVGHYNRPDVFRLAVDTAPRPAVVEMGLVSDVD